MENATEALIMAGSVLLLIIALTVSISSFTSLKNQVDGIIQQGEETELAQAQDEEGNYYYLNYIKNADDIRTVGVETVISSIRRLRRESYTVYIYLNDETMKDIKRNNILNDYGIITTSSKKQEYNGTQIIPNEAEILQFLLKGSGYQSISNEVMEELREIIKNNNFKEYLGIYQKADTTDNVSSANKTTYRIITYVQQT